MPRLGARSKMMRSNSSRRRSNSSSVGNGMSASSFCGVKSCLSGGRRIEKWTTSTAGSDFSKLRHTRAPGCGSPVISSTRSRSRTPLAANAARLLESVISCGPSAASTITMLRPRRGKRTSMLKSRLARTIVCVTRWPSMLTVTGTCTSPALSITRALMRIGSLTMPKVGADTSSRRLSPRSGSPTINMCAGPRALRRRGSAGGSTA